MHLFSENATTYLASIAVVTAVHYFYWVFKNKWPSHYLSESDAIGFYLRVNPARYVTFRILPVFLITLILVSLFNSLSTKDSILAGLYAGFLHAIFSNLRMFLKLVLNFKTIYKYVNKLFQILFHLFTGIVVILTMVIAGYLSTFSFVQKIIPSIEGLVDNVWAALITILIAVPLLRFLEQPLFDELSVIFKNLASIGKENLSAIRSESLKYKADMTLVCSICIIENIQRPIWFRKLENLKARIRANGTYGIMQVGTDRLISDVDSIRIAIETYLKETDGLNEDELDVVIRKYNNDPEYASIVLKVYSSLKFLGKDIEKVVAEFENQDNN